ncbi:MAG: lysine exporter LysO family protein [Candidatus Bathycorpusculaceae bacterium]
MIKYILIVLALGIAAGYANNNYGPAFPNGWVSDYLFNFSLILLLFVMGFVFGADKQAAANLRKTGWKIFIIPLSIAVGSILGGLVGGYILGINPVGSMAVSAGFGWYTLAGPLAWQLFGMEFGALGFVANFLRELLTILAIPLMVKVNRYAPIASGGATAMDTTLPIIVRYCGSDSVIIAFLSGFILSLIAPFTITAIATLPH